MQITVSTDIFNRIVKEMRSCIKVVDDIKPYYKGYSPKGVYYYCKRNSGEYLIIQEYILHAFIPEYKSPNTWVQVILRKVEEQVEPYHKDVTGLYAWNYMLKRLKEFYTEEEINNILLSYKTPYDYKLKQYHCFYHYKQFEIVKHTDCYKYDINGAHADAMRNMFPKAWDMITNLYRQRKKNPVYKALINYFIGFIKHKGYEGAYNWIVQRTTNMLMNHIKLSNGFIVYANTDGYIISHPQNILSTSKELGEFKLEYQGDIYTYSSNNFEVYQAYNNGELIETKGSIRMSARKYVNLANGETISYELHKDNLEGIKVEELSNIKTLKLDIRENKSWEILV